MMSKFLQDKKLVFALLILSLAGFVTSFGAHIIAVNLPTYATATGTGLFGIGVLIAVYDLAEVIAKPVFGFIADRKGMKLTLLTGLAVFSFSSLLYFVIDPSLLVVVRLSQGMGAAAFSVASMSLVAEYFKDNLEGPMCIYNAIKGLGYVISPVIGGGIVWTLSTVAVAKAAGPGSIGLAMGNLGSFKEIGDMAGPLVIGLVAQLVSLTAGFVICGLLGLIILVPLLLSVRSRRAVMAEKSN